MRTSIVFIGTGKYINFLPRYYDSIKKHLAVDSEKRFHIFTDQTGFASWPADANVYQIQHMQWPFITLLRYKFMSLAIDRIADADNCLFVDADLMWNSETSINELFGEKSHFGVQHPGFVFDPSKATFERRIESKAHVIESDDLSTYWQGCLWGAKSDQFSSMVRCLSDNVDSDLEKKVVAIWHDESHLNRYFIDNKSDVNTLHPGFATPENWEIIKKAFPTKALHLHKKMEDFPRFEGLG